MSARSIWPGAYRRRRVGAKRIAPALSASCLTSAFGVLYEACVTRHLSVDVVIVGGRPAGASLAAHLGKRGKKVFILDKSAHPSPPSVPSCPVLYAPAMQLLDQLGVEESQYADESAKVPAFGFEVDGFFRTTIEVPSALGRNYAMGIDRARFDALLWDRLAQFESVERRALCAFRGVLRATDGTVTGIVAEDAEGRFEVHAPLTVGADGRFSSVARQVGAAIVEDHSQQTSTVHFADWQGLKAFSPELTQAASLCVCGRGTTVLFFPAPGGKTMVATHIRSDRAELAGDATRFYEGALSRYEGVRRRLDGAKRVSSVVGLKRIGNRMLEPAGRGWALVGDAFHHKDPVDGQGIYDALLEAKLLDAHLDSLAGYREAVLAATMPMFRATVKRLKTELYQDPPAIVVKTFLRWLMTDPEYQRRFLLFLARQEPAETWPPPGLLAGAALRGAGRDLKSLWG